MNRRDHRTAHRGRDDKRTRFAALAAQFADEADVIVPPPAARPHRDQAPAPTRARVATLTVVEAPRRRDTSAGMRIRCCPADGCKTLTLGAACRAHADAYEPTEEPA